MEIALRALKATVAKAQTYHEGDDHIAEILRTHICDVSDDIHFLEKYHKSYKEQELTILELIANARELKRDMERTALPLEIAARAAEREAAANAQPRQPPPPPQNPQLGNAVRALIAPLPVFDGVNSHEYRGFKEAWDDYVATSGEMTPVRKWLLLRAQLVGKALEMVRCLPTAPESYEVALKILEQHFGGDRRARLNLYQQLQLLPNAVLETESLRLTQTQLEGILLSMEHLKVDTASDDFLRAVVLSKFPAELRHLLRVTNDTSLMDFRQALSEYVVSRDCTLEAVTTVLADRRPASTPSQPMMSQGASNQSQRRNGVSGGAEGSSQKQRHGTTQSTGGGGTTQGVVPPEQVPPNNNSTPHQSKSKRSRGRHKCVFCLGDHWADQCPVYKTAAERVKRIPDRCNKCLKTKHEGACVNWLGCAHCQSKEHNRALCPVQFAVPVMLLDGEREGRSDGTGAERGDGNRFVTMMLQAGNLKQTKRTDARAIIDTAGCRSLITRDLVDQLELGAPGTKRLRLTGANNVPLCDGDTSTRQLLLLPPNAAPIKIEVCVVDSITERAVAVDVNEFKTAHPRYASLPMPSEGNGLRAQILLGYRSLACGVLTLQNCVFVEPGLQLMSTKWGWVPFGGFPADSGDESDTAPVLLINETDPLKLMSDLELVGLGEFLHSETQQEEEALERFHRTTKIVDGRYQIEWPWRHADPEIEDNFGVAYGRLVTLHKQLSKDPALLRAYNDIIREHKDAEIIESVERDERAPPRRVHYLPHRGVIRVGKSTPIRLVFDASSRKNRRTHSLNDLILKGGNWVNELPAILLRFRRYGVAVVSDIEKAFHQILIAPNDRDVVRFLWLRDVTKPPSKTNLCVYRFRRMAFGVIASPFLLTATIRNHFRLHPNKYIHLLESDLYADNLVVSLPVDADPAQFYPTIKGSFGALSMNIAKWATNSELVRRTIPVADRVGEEEQSVLGLQWHTRTDQMRVRSPRLPPLSGAAVTKRSALREMAKVYDPLGWVAPVVLAARLFVRKLWQMDYAWDTPITSELAADWLVLRRQLNRVDEVVIPRAYAQGAFERATRIETHTFSDASANAYGGVVYLVVYTPNGVWQGLLASKTRLTPKNQPSIPRLELVAAVIGTRYTLYVLNALQSKQKIYQYLWSDSRCVIAWSSSNKILPAFIERATDEIKKAGYEEFRFVPGDQNPADVASRGATIEALLEQDWWRGPAWLGDKSTWPSNKDTCPQKTQQLIGETLHNLCVEEERILLIGSAVYVRRSLLPRIEDSPFQLDPNNFSTLRRLLRRTAFCKDAVRRFFRRRPAAAKYAADSGDTLARWLRWDQRRAYETEKQADNKTVSYLRNMKVRLDEEGLLRCVTRLELAQLPRDEKEPILLVKDSKLTRLIILDVHEKALHAGTAHTLALLRQRYWLPHGRRQVFKTVRQDCLQCRRYAAQPYQMPDMAPLPPFRITKTERPFTNIGVDVYGPYKVRLGTESNGPIVKRWVIIYTCLVVRAVHLEVLTDMKAASFLNSLRKFVARRGVPKLIVCDNAPQFKAMEGYFQCMWRRFAEADENVNYYAQHEIEWRYIPPTSPWMGGVYERLVQVVKRAFEKTYGNVILSDECFQIAIMEVEAVVNSRPVTYVGQEQATALITPNDFLRVRYPSMPIDFNKQQTTDELGAKWRTGERYLEQFWRVWSEDYLRALNERRDSMPNARSTTRRQPVPGDMVLMIDPTQKRSLWRLAVVEKLMPSDCDQQIRSVLIKVANRGRFIRPVNKLAPLDLLQDLPDNLTILNGNIVIDETPGVFCD